MYLAKPVWEILSIAVQVCSLHPQGWCGLKFADRHLRLVHIMVSTRKGGVD